MNRPNLLVTPSSTAIFCLRVQTSSPSRPRQPGELGRHPKPSPPRHIQHRSEIARQRLFPLVRRNSIRFTRVIRGLDLRGFDPASKNERILMCLRA
jgi:hypothetical protein